MNPKTLCRYNKFGYCKFVKKYHFRRYNTVCKESNCKISEFEKRHPKSCKYKRDNGRCKFTPCAYDHEKQMDISKNSKKFSILKIKLRKWK